MFQGIFKTKVSAQYLQQCMILEMLVVSSMAYSGLDLFIFLLLLKLLDLKYSTWHFLCTNRTFIVISGSTWEQGKLAKTFK